MTLGRLHLLSAIVSLVLGAYVFLGTRKGTRLHRQAGWAYVIAMVTLNVTALMIYRLLGFFGPFHVAAVVSLATLIPGVLTARAARSRRLARDKSAANHVTSHYMWMSYAYVGLVAAAVAETATRVPAFRPGPGQGATFSIVVGVASVAVFVVGSRMIKRRAEAALAPFAGR